MSRKRHPRQRARALPPVALVTRRGESVQLADGTSALSSYTSPNSVFANAKVWPGAQSSGKPYPPMDKVSDTKPLLKSLGATGTAIFSGIITSEEYNPDFHWRDGIAIYEQMIRNDAQVFAVVQMLELPIRRATWSIEPASDDARDKEIASFVESCLFHDMTYTTSSGRVLAQKWDDLLRHILMHLRYGFMPFEVCWKIEDGWVKWARWTPLLPRTIWRWWVGEDNELVGIQQWTFKNYSYQFVDIPADKLLLFVHRQEGNNYDGVSVLRSAYKHWFYKDNMYKIQAIGVERNAVIPPIVKLPENATGADVTAGQTISQNIRANELLGITLPFGWDLEYPRNFEKYAAQEQPAIEHHDVMIARNVLAQFINLGSTETGAYALADSQTRTFLEALQSVCEYIEDVINTDAIPRLVDYNFDGVAVYPRLTASKVAMSDITDVAAPLAQLVSGGLIHPDPELEDFLREQFGLPSAPQSVVNAYNPTAPTTPSRPQNANADVHEDVASKPVVEDRTPPTPSDDSDGVGADGGGESGLGPGGATGLAELTELRLLREALQLVGGLDAVERGQVFYSPDQPRDARGRFTYGGGGSKRESGGGSGGSGRSGRSGGAGKSAGRGSGTRSGGRAGGGSSEASGKGDTKGTRGQKAKIAVRPRAPTAPESTAEAHARAVLEHQNRMRTDREGTLARARARSAEKEAERIANSDTPKAEAIRQGFRDWASGRAFLSNSGNYRLYNVDSDGYKTRGSTAASWSRAVKSTFPDNLDFHLAATHYAGMRPNEITPIKRSVGLDESGEIDVYVLMVEGGDA
jgi:hypothetical protein